MSEQKNCCLFGFHAVSARLRHNAESVKEVYVDAGRVDRRMQDFMALAQEKQVKLIPVQQERLDRLVGTRRHQGVVAQARVVKLTQDFAAFLRGLEDFSVPPLLLVLDGITDPHNLGACLRVADGLGAHAVIAPKDRAVGINATVTKVASGAVDTVPYLVVTNLSSTLRTLKDHGLHIIGTAEDGPHPLHAADFMGPAALVMGSEAEGMRRLTRSHCDQLVHIPMSGSVESLNISVACGVCLYEARRQRDARLAIVPS